MSVLHILWKHRLVANNILAILGSIQLGHKLV